MANLGPTSNFALGGPTGVGGLKSFNGYLYDEWLRDLQGPRGRRVLREMQDNDPMVGAILFAIEMLIRQVKFSFESDPAAPEDDPRTEFVDGCWHDMATTPEDTLSEILTFLPHGWCLNETLFKYRDGIGSAFSDGYIGWHSWPMRSQETLQRWLFGPNGEILAMVQLGPPDYLQHTIPLEKALLFRTTTRRGSPEGRSILRNAFRPWFFKKQMEQIEAIGVERDLAGLPVAKVPMELLGANLTPDQANLRDTIYQIVTNIRRNELEGVVWPLSYDENGKEEYILELLSTGGQRQFDTDAIIARYDQRILMTVMADMIMLGHEKVGSNALAESKGKLFTTALGAWLQSICSIINDVAIPRLLKLNGMPTENPPRLVHGDISRPDLDLLGTFMQHLSAAGFELDTRFDSDLTARLLDIAGLPEPPEDLPPALHESTLTVNQPTEGAPQPTPAPAPPQTG